MYRTNSNPSRPQRRRSFKGWLKRMTLPNNQRRIEPQVKEGVFGVPLNTSIEYAKTTVGYIDEDGVKHSKAGSIPIVVAKCGSFLKKNGLETEGIFRVSGNMKRVNALEFQFDQGASHYGLDFNWNGYTVHDAANLLTRYLNKLPEPVIPTEYYIAFRDVMNNNVCHTTEERIDAFQALIQDLPSPHRHLLLYLLDTLSLFAANASQTKMTTSNLAAVFCPGILRHPDYNTPIQYKISQCVIEFLIEFQSLFTIQLLDKKKRMSTASSEEVPWLVPSMHQPTPPLPLRVVNGSVHSESSEESPKALVSSPTGISSKQMTTTSREINQPFKQKLKDTVSPWIARMAGLLVCGPAAFLLAGVASYEAYLALTLHKLTEPLIFFAGLASYCTLLIIGLFGSISLDDPASEEAMRQDQALMSEWRDLLTRSWKTEKEDECCSIMSQSSRFNEEEEQSSEEEEEDEMEESDLGFDPATLEMYLSQYDQIKKDAELAKKLQSEEQKARDVHNPFVNEKQVSNDKEVWKIKTFSKET
ncbi:hypothetical protein RMATCC62417_03276 [Rhizopus microsporus]|nr:hypothetical protein RMATCC62417_03276 [Rhizopus microsporus]